MSDYWDRSLNIQFCKFKNRLTSIWTKDKRKCPFLLDEFFKRGKDVNYWEVMHWTLNKDPTERPSFLIKEFHYAILSIHIKKHSKYSYLGKLFQFFWLAFCRFHTWRIFSFPCFDKIIENGPFKSHHLSLWFLHICTDVKYGKNKIWRFSFCTGFPSLRRNNSNEITTLN